MTTPFEPVDPAADAVPSRPELAHVIGDAPAAVLVVDLGSQQVLHANEVAAELAPELTLPVAVDAWSDVAVLHDLDGSRLSGTAHPLSRLARREPVEGQAVSAERRSALGAARETLWVVGVPMTGAPALEDHALVVFLPIREHEAARAIEALREIDATVLEDPDDPRHTFYQRAVLATGLSFTVADATSDDLELVWVNPAFTATTGYSFDEAVGRNCRFLQGPGSAPASTARMRQALRDGAAITETLLNYRKDGLAFWNQVTMSPIFDGRGEVTHFVGVQTDVSGRIEADRARDDALDAAEQARNQAVQAQDRLQLLTDAADQLSDQLNPDELQHRLTEILTPGWADLVAVLHLDRAAEHTSAVVRHSDDAQQGDAEHWAAGAAAALTSGAELDAAFGLGSASLLLDLTGPAPRQGEDAPASLGAITDGLAELGMASAGVVGVRGRRGGGVGDLLVLGRGDDLPAFDSSDMALAGDLGRRAGLLLENARLYQEQRHIAETLQRSLLPQLTDLPGITVASRYLPGSTAEIGGDFFDVFTLPDGAVTLVVGDVVGHDIYAAAAMGHLKGLISAVAHDPSLRPAAIIERVDQLLLAQRVDTLATILVAQLWRSESDSMARTSGPGERSGVWQVTWASAGHPPLLLRHPDRTVQTLELGRGRRSMLGVDATGHHLAPRLDSHVTVPDGSTLVAYTDGLIVRRGGEAVDTALDRLAEVLAEAPDDLEQMCDRIVHGAESEAQDAGLDPREDDTALVVLRVDSQGGDQHPDRR
ncbi:SpoIIE family protein phosphatase [Nocardioides marinquilinus]|uniref:SpoIIE family protein phosphatase n=1 Tax=Nocardioides marinquilinus TaxID=1210400 RepID=UPI0031EC69CD